MLDTTNTRRKLTHATSLYQSHNLPRVTESQTFFVVKIFLKDFPLSSITILTQSNSAYAEQATCLQFTLFVFKS